MDKLILKGIRFHGRHGVPETERNVGGHYEIDAKVSRCLINAGQTDAVEQTVDYAEVVALIVEIGTTASFHLVEALAEKIAAEILARFDVAQVQLTVKKLSPPIAQPIKYFAVHIQRTENSRCN